MRADTGYINLTQFTPLFKDALGGAGEADPQKWGESLCLDWYELAQMVISTFCRFG